MNKIIMNNNIIDKVSLNNCISLEYINKECPFSINDVKITVDKDTELEIVTNLKEETKLNFIFNIINNSTFKLDIITKGIGGKIQYRYNIDDHSKVLVNKYQNLSNIKEMIIVNLNDENSKFDYNFKTIALSKETYDYHIFHKAKNTISNIKNNGVSIKDGLITFQVSSFVPQNITGCIVNQQNRIINLNDSKCEILPNLYIDCNDVSANHSALIGKFSSLEMFYLMSRGLDYNTSLNLLIKGFLTSNIDNKDLLNNINKNIDKYWR